MESPSTRAIAVYCASSVGRQPAYVHAAESLGKALAEAGRPLVYGGGSLGIMGAVSGAVLKNGGDVVGVVPQAMITAGGEVDQTEGRRGPTVAIEEKGKEKVQTIVVTSMHERKLEMAKRSSGFIGLPGGFGTFEEVLEVICWTQLGIHEKPIVVLNVLRYYDPLHELIKSGVREGFILPQNEHLACFINGPADLDEHITFDWGQAAVQALDSWIPEERTHFYDWTGGTRPDGKKKDDSLDAA